MAFDFKALRVLSATEDGFAHFHYWTEDDAATIEAPGYFGGDAIVYFQVDNQITVRCAEGSAIYFVTGKTAEHITVQRVTELARRQEPSRG